MADHDKTKIISKMEGELINNGLDRLNSVDLSINNVINTPVNTRDLQNQCSENILPISSYHNSTSLATSLASTSSSGSFQQHQEALMIMQQLTSILSQQQPQQLPVSFQQPNNQPSQQLLLQQLLQQQITKMPQNLPSNSQQQSSLVHQTPNFNAQPLNVQQQSNPLLNGQVNQQQLILQLLNSQQLNSQQQLNTNQNLSNPQLNNSQQFSTSPQIANNQSILSNQQIATQQLLQQIFPNLQSNQHQSAALNQLHQLQMQRQQLEQLHQQIISALLQQTNITSSNNNTRLVNNNLNQTSQLNTNLNIQQQNAQNVLRAQNLARAQLLNMQQLGTVSSGMTVRVPVNQPKIFSPRNQTAGLPQAQFQQIAPILLPSSKGFVNPKTVKNINPNSNLTTHVTISIPLSLVSTQGSTPSANQITSMSTVYSSSQSNSCLPSLCVTSNISNANSVANFGNVILNNNSVLFTQGNQVMLQNNNNLENYQQSLVTISNLQSNQNLVVSQNNMATLVSGIAHENNMTTLNNEGNVNINGIMDLLGQNIMQNYKGSQGDLIGNNNDYMPSSLMERQVVTSSNSSILPVVIMPNYPIFRQPTFPGNSTALSHSQNSFPLNQTQINELRSISENMQNNILVSKEINVDKNKNFNIEENKKTKQLFNTDQIDKNIVTSQKQTAKVLPQILTHVIEGFIIHEGPEPFPIQKSAFIDEMMDSDSDELTDSSASENENSANDNVFPNINDGKNFEKDNTNIKCHYCSKVLDKENDVKNSRYCSLSCTKRHAASQRWMKHYDNNQFNSSQPVKKKKSPKQTPEILPNKVINIIPVNADLSNSCSNNNLNDVSLATISESSLAASTLNQVNMSIEFPQFNDEKIMSIQNTVAELSTLPSQNFNQQLMNLPLISETIDAPIKELQLNNSRYLIPSQPSAPQISFNLNQDCDPELWGVEEVYNFVKGLPGCALHAEEFKNQEIDGSALLLLNVEHLTSTLNVKLGPALKIVSQIRTLKNTFLPQPL